MWITVLQTSVGKESIKLSTTSEEGAKFDNIVPQTDGSFLIEGVEFLGSPKPGKYEITVSYDTFHAVVSMELEAGMPTKLNPVGWNPSEVS